MARQAFLRRINYTFQNNQLLDLALTHRSASHHHNERLEFLGDALLNQIIAAELFTRFTRATEGEMSRMRAQLVKEKTLAELALELQLGDLLYLGGGELKSGGFRRESILADALEALFGAIYLDGGIAQCSAIVLALFESRLQLLAHDCAGKDAKTLLQEYLQSRREALPQYELLGADGEAHAQIFYVRCSLMSGVSGDGQGSSRRRAEQQAAEAVLQQVKALTNAAKKVKSS